MPYIYLSICTCNDDSHLQYKMTIMIVWLWRMHISKCIICIYIYFYFFCFWFWDLPTPRIHIVGTLPFISGTTAKLECVAKKTTARFLLTWKCGYITYDKRFISNNTSVWSVLLLKVDSSYNNITCQCIIQIPGVNFSLIDDVTLRITSKLIGTFWK